ncbi:glycosyltransferase [Aquiflexum gelatinilyticum]|uniref:glycosyltransferase n=1 Tax=Aquiflexum gelatinilyticum TaxID=2961943 RepID=UPI0021674146|nr:glycosyltransferase [Aquiflexum gelatinilyticum]MCS4435957.1 glycosyltransferase [Aquiflexum gelatinilyticum]
MIYGLAVIVVFLLLLQDFLLVALLQMNFEKYDEAQKPDFPKVSVLIPCRNEAQNLPRCLDSIEKLDYPKDSIQFVFGNDRSTDGTADILQKWVNVHPNSIMVEITEGDQKRRNGKANALSQMDKVAVGEFFLFTDADCAVSPQWINSMLLAQKSTGSGIVTGITHIGSDLLFGKMQAFDWWLSLGMVKVINDLGISVTSMGNNMLITKEAYDSVGGFEGIPFSLTEDFEMGKAIEKNGYKAIHHVSGENLVETLPQQNLKGLLGQRKRWMYGAMKLPLYWRAVLAMQVLFFPAIIFLCFLQPFEGVNVWLVKVAIQSLFIYRFAFKTDQKLRISTLFLFEIYYLFTSWSTIVYYFWPSKTDWKGRKYG